MILRSSPLRARLFFGLFCTVVASTSWAQSDTSSGARSLYLIGDAGLAGEDHSAPVLRLLLQVASSDGSAERTLLFLGDNIYEHGLHAPGHPERSHDSINMQVQVDAARAFPGRSIIIPGNHDWAQGGADGMSTVLREQAFVEARLGDDAFAPDEATPGPVVVDPGGQAMLILIDSQWWLHPHQRGPGHDDSLLHNLQRIMDRYSDRRIVLAMHHPLHTCGSHGGRFPLRDHLFPLTNLNKHLWLPLPVVGSLYPFSRKLFASRQDLGHPRYRELRTRIETLMQRYPGTIHVSGHEHALQYLTRDGSHFIVSGSGAKSTWLQRTPKLTFGTSERGFAQVRFATDGSVSVAFFTVDGGAQPAWSTVLPSQH